MLSLVAARCIFRRVGDDTFELRHAIGELLTCPFCFAVWVATYLIYGLVFVPRVTRLIASVFCMVTLSDTLQDLYDMLKNKAEAPKSPVTAYRASMRQPTPLGSIKE